MEKIANGQIELLIELQQKELSLAKLQSKLDALPAKIEQIFSCLSEFEESINAEKSHLAEQKKAYRSHDADFQSGQERIKKREIQLRSVTTNKEYQAILKEIEEIKKSNSRLEDLTLECLEKIDAAETLVKEKAQALQIEQEAVNQQKSALTADADKERQVLEKLLEERNHVAAGIDSGLMQQYETIKMQARGIAIVEVQDSICQGCHMNIPPQMYNELHRENEMRICPHCHRMLYVLKEANMEIS